MAAPPRGEKTDAGALIALGVVTRPHGLRGEVRLHAHNPDSTLLLERERILLRRPDGHEAREVSLEARPGPKGSLLARIGGVDGRDAAEALRGAELLVPRGELPPTAEDEWYHVDLVGLEVRDGDGARRGEVAEVVVYPTVDCLRVVSEDGEREVPMADPWLVSVDLEAGRVVVEGLEELPPERPRRGGRE